ncbi:MAG TPA: SusC/RagA family TonB-linked outer membrane protein [Porphyromonadaceae bacterium]|nr:SusC/RagA family TonB-linked outer membrane protein [Porphyromonadaceae bacterium]HBL32296.1 SusC/RagA family TonB-linked outer membrane protein [Porphyromonadaceae bacterium]HBX20165.1 SusC/RagA family TonB-linked outer membrane protein [Porphyromonadaceae bacterium]HCM22138.1 SusC/RagA family TonB-linked outer membrane protein [Porphyromonadaceae bacterium]
MEGIVYDDTKQALPGVSVYIRDKISVGTITDVNGKFSIRASRGDMIVFTFVGYEKVEYLVTEEKKDLAITFTETAQELEEVVVMGLGTQRKISTVAAVSSINVKELQTPAASVANLLGGRVAGVISMQTSGEPGKNIAEFWVRGIGTFGANASALVLIDGLEGNINSIDPADIESFSVLKDASATAVYGVRGANGVVLVTTKRGQAGKLNITARANFSVSNLRRVPQYLRAYDYAKLANEARMVRGDSPVYTDVELDIIEDGSDADLYPDVNWQDEVLRDNSFKQTYYVSARGGAQAARYFLSLGISNETAAYKYDKNSVYAANTGYNTYNYRANIDLNLSPSTTLYFGTDGFLSVQNNPGVASTDYIWQAQANLNPLLLPVKYSNGQLPAQGTGGSYRSPIVMINQMGRRTNQEYRGKFTLAADQNLSMLLKGLKLKVQGAYDLTSWFYEGRYIQPSLYQAVGRDQQGKLVTIERVKEGGVSYGRSTDQYRKYHFESTLNYENVFAEDHRVSGLLYYYISDQKKASEGTNNLSAIPIRYQGVSSRLTYGFRDTYMIDFNFGYTGSENFQPGKQYGFFPSVALGWVPTNYTFMRDRLPWISFLKFRGSYGSVGNDRITSRRFPYLTMVNRGYAYPWGMSAAVERINETIIGADNLQWEKALKANIGIEANFFNDKAQLVFDVFNDQRNGIFMERVQIPDYVGLITKPFGNVGKMKSYGADGNVSFTQDFGKDMSFTVRGNFTYSKNDVQNWEEANPKYPYQEASGYPHGVIRGYQSVGLYKDWDDVRNSPAQFGTVMPGDIKYRDVNGDGKIDTDDKVALSYSTLPLLMYGFGGEFRYKNLTVGVLFKGTGKTDFFHVGYDHPNDDPNLGINGPGYVPFYNGVNGNVLTVANNPSNRWIPREYAAANGIDPALAENPNARFPRLTYGYNENNSQLSDFWKGDAGYLRLSEVTVNYNLKTPFLQKMKIQSIDFQLVGSNLLLWDKVKLFDPEQAYKNGQVYPIPTTYTLQMYINL